MRHLSINIGFITNSSSVVHHFPAELLKHPKIAAFMEAFEIKDGFIGKNLGYRQDSPTIAITKGQKAEVYANLRTEEADIPEGDIPEINVDSDDFVVIYDDESESIVTALVRLIDECSPDDYPGEQYL